MSGTDKTLATAPPTAGPNCYRGGILSDAEFLTEMRRDFDALAPRWDTEHGPMSANAAGFRSCVTYLRHVCRTLRTRHVLDLGCGTGQHILNLSDQIIAGLAVDLSPRMIERARTNASGRPFGKRIRFECAAVEELQPDRLGRFDLVLFIGSLEHVRHQRAALNVARRLLAPDGRIVAVMRFPSRPGGPMPRRSDRHRDIPKTRHLTPNMLRYAASNAGLRLVRVNALPSGPDASAPLRRAVRQYRTLPAVDRYAAMLEPLKRQRQRGRASRLPKPQ